MSRLLAELCCPRGLGECRALLRGTVAAQKTPLPSVVVRALFDGRQPRFRDLAHAERFVSSLFGLIGELDARFVAAPWRGDGGEPIDPKGGRIPRRARLAGAPPPSGEQAESAPSRGPLVGSLEDRAAARYLEVRAFLSGLDLGATDPALLDDRGRQALATLSEAGAYLGAISGLAGRHAPTDEAVHRMAEMSLAELETVTSTCMVAIEASLRQRRAPDGTRLPGSGVGPNDLCPCDSGKPRQRCCGGPS